MKKRRKEILRYLAALRVRDRYARRKIARRVALSALALVAAVTAASPADAKKVTDEELAAFLSGKPLPKAAPASAPVTRVTPAEAAPAASAGAVPAVKEAAPAASVPAAPEKTGSKKPQEEPFLTERKTLVGSVGGATSRSLSVEYAVEGPVSEEMLFHYAPGMKLKGVKKVSQLGHGDRVEVVYDVTYRENEKKERVNLKTEAVQITLVRKAPSKLESREAENAGDDAS